MTSIMHAFQVFLHSYVHACVCVCRDDYNSLTSQVILLNVWPLILYLSDVQSN